MMISSGALSQRPLEAIEKSSLERLYGLMSSITFQLNRLKTVGCETKNVEVYEQADTRVIL